MNNYEHLIEGGPEALRKFMNESKCCHCAEWIDGQNVCRLDSSKCEPGMMDWFEEEHEEPSYEKNQARYILRKLKNAHNECEFLTGNPERRCKNCAFLNSNCFDTMKKTIMYHIKEIAGV